MTIRELHDELSAQVDELQSKAVKAGRDQVYYTHQVTEVQTKMKQLTKMLFDTGADRELTGSELLQLSEK